MVGFVVLIDSICSCGAKDTLPPPPLSLSTPCSQSSGGCAAKFSCYSSSICTQLVATILLWDRQPLVWRIKYCRRWHQGGLRWGSNVGLWFCRFDLIDSIVRMMFYFIFWLSISCTVLVSVVIPVMTASAQLPRFHRCFRGSPRFPPIERKKALFQQGGGGDGSTGRSPHNSIGELGRHPLL